jgi:hypothetical protein
MRPCLRVIYSAGCPIQTLIGEEWVRPCVVPENPVGLCRALACVCVKVKLRVGQVEGRTGTLGGVRVTRLSWRYWAILG